MHQMIGSIVGLGGVMTIAYIGGWPVPLWLWGIIGLYMGGLVFCLVCDRRKIFHKYIVWRYGVSGTYRLKPPLGFDPWTKPSWWMVAIYLAKKLLWRIESRVYVRINDH